VIIDNDEKRKIRKREIEEEKKQREEIEKNSKKNKNFVMIYRDHMPEMRWLIGKSGISANIFNFIIEHMDYKNALMCSYAVFVDYFGVSISTVKRAIKLLKDSGFVDILKSGTSNVYIVNYQVAWTAYENQKKYCKFEGNVLISASENKDYVYRSQFDKLKILREREHIK
jgi:hypothetical protein